MIDHGTEATDAMIRRLMADENDAGNIANGYSPDDVRAIMGIEETGHEYDHDGDNSIYGSAC